MNKNKIKCLLVQIKTASQTDQKLIRYAQDKPDSPDFTAPAPAPAVTHPTTKSDTPSAPEFVGPVPTPSNRGGVPKPTGQVYHADISIVAVKKMQEAM